MPTKEVYSYSKWFEMWSKSLAGAGYIIDDYDFYLNNFNWLKIWFKNYSNKYLETIYLLIFISIVFVALFRPLNNKVLFNRNIYLLLFILFCIFLFWFFKHPTLRYGGFAVHLSLSSLILSLYLSNTKTDYNKFKKLSLVIVIISLTVFSIKNFTRIYDEFNRNDEYKFLSFPYFYLKKTEFKTINLSDKLSISYVYGDSCWNAPPPCGSNKDLTVKEFKGYYIIIRKD